MYYSYVKVLGNFFFILLLNAMNRFFYENLSFSIIFRHTHRVYLELQFN